MVEREPKDWSDDETLGKARRHVRQGFAQGTYCPCCGQRVQLYERKLSSTAARSLITLVKLYLKDHDWHHVKELGAPGSGGEFARLERWGLIAAKYNDESHKKTSGMWKPTETGISFANNKIRVPRCVFMYNQKTLGFSEDEQITIEEALGDHFNYRELMGYLL